MNQELEEDAAIEEACKLNHGVTFPLFSKIDVNGTNAHPLYKYLTSEAPAHWASRRSNGTSPSFWWTAAAR